MSGGYLDDGDVEDAWSSSDMHKVMVSEEDDIDDAGTKNSPPKFLTFVDRPYQPPSLSNPGNLSYHDLELRLGPPMDPSRSPSGVVVPEIFGPGYFEATGPGWNIFRQGQQRGCSREVNRENYFVPRRSQVSVDTQAVASRQERGGPSQECAMVNDRAAGSSKNKLKLTCTICMDVMADEATTVCGHVFCKSCIFGAIEAQMKCSKCRKPLTMSCIRRI